jgi:hypothetical protein
MKAASKRHMDKVVHRGCDAMWLWFGLSHAGWITMPRVMVHDMPDEWQAKFAELLKEWDGTWVNQPDLTTCVGVKSGTRFVRSPDWLTNYRHPNREQLKMLRGA